MNICRENMLAFFYATDEAAAHAGPHDRVTEAVCKIADNLGADPGNTGNRLADALDAIAENVDGGSGGGAGYTVQETEVTIFPETELEFDIEQEGGFYSTEVMLSDWPFTDGFPKSINVSFDGTVGKLPLVSKEDHLYGYNDDEMYPDWSKAPIAVGFDFYEIPHAILLIQSQGIHTVSASFMTKEVVPSDDFTTAVVNSLPVVHFTNILGEEPGIESDIPFDAIPDFAVNNLVGMYNGSMFRLFKDRDTFIGSGMIVRNVKSINEESEADVDMFTLEYGPIINISKVSGTITIRNRK